MGLVTLSEVVGYVGGLLNTAAWDNLVDVTLNGTTAITSASAGFTQNDVGKYFSIPGGGGTNQPLIGYISAVGSATAATLSVAAAVSQTLANMQYGGVTDDPRHSLWKITKAILQKDLEVCHAILSQPNHPRRNFFTFSANTPRANTNTGLPVVSHSGELLMVEVKHTDTVWRVGKRLPEAWLPKLLTWLNNRSSLFSTASEGYYVTANGQLYFTGTFIRETYADLSLTAACQAPSEFTSMVAVLAAADCFATEGDDIAASQLLAGFGGASFAALIGGAQ